VTSPAELAGRAHRATESLHSLIYFVPEAEEQLVATGLRPGRMCYFASRSAPMGAVSPGVTAATFVNFNPDLVARFIPRAWTLASTEAILDARLRSADLALRRLLGDAVDGPEVRELAELTREATTALTPEGRPLYAGHADLPWPTEPHLVLWHAVTLLRESRGDGHTMALAHARLNGIESIVTHTATGRGFTVEAAKLLRGWSDEQWEAAQARLRERGLMDGNALTAEGSALRATIEAETDELDTPPWHHLGAERTARVIELGKSLSRTVVGNGAFPASGVFAQ
jgi:helix-turn-helix protein